MSFNKRYIPNEKNYLKKEYLEMGHDRFFRIYRKYDAFTMGHETNEFFLKYIFFENREYKKGSYELNEFFYLKSRRIYYYIKSKINKLNYVLRSKS